MDERDRLDPWRRRMQRAAERLRALDAPRFEVQIGRIEACLEQDAHWDLNAALNCYDRRHATE